MDVEPDDFKPFLERYKKTLKSSDHLIIDYYDLEKWDSNIAEELVKRPDCILPIIESCTLNFVDEEASISIKNSPINISLQSLRSEYLGKLIGVDGIISQVVPTRPRIETAAYKCSKSGKIIYVPQDGPFLSRPPRCGKGGGIAELLGHPETTFIDGQELGIQERPENLRAGQVSPPVNLWITRRHLINGARAGDIVKVVGILKELKPSAATREINWDFYIDVVYIETVNKDPSEVKITDEEEKEIRWLASDPEIYDKIIASIAPSIYGCKLIKEAAMYQLFGGVEKVLSDRVVRGTIHILWIDEPSMAKSQFSMRIRDLALRGVYVAGGGASGAGLTAAIIWLKHGRPLLEAGALVIANQGICCVDEIEKMNKEDRVRIHEAMAQGVVNIQKAGHHYSLPAKTSIFATGNPTFGRYDLDRTIKENISLPPTIISRFDLIFIGKGEMNDVKGITSHILRTMKTGKAPISKKLLKKYVAFAKKFKPELTEEAIDCLQKFYLNLAKVKNPNSPVAITPRQLEGLIRLSEAHARIRLSEQVTKGDAEAAINIMLESLRQAGIDPATGGIDIDTIMTGVPKTVRDKMSVLVGFLGEERSREEIYEFMEEKGISRAESGKLLRQLHNDGMITEPRMGYYRRVK